jgi:hypothetical protein
VEARRSSRRGESLCDANLSGDGTGYQVTVDLETRPR